EEAVDHFVDGAVAAHGDDQIAAVAQRLAGEVGRVHGPLGEGVRAFAQRVAHGVGDGIEVARGGAVGRARIDDEEAFHWESQRLRMETTSLAPRAAAQAGLEVTMSGPSSARRSSASFL